MRMIQDGFPGLSVVEGLAETRIRIEPYDVTASHEFPSQVGREPIRDRIPIAAAAVHVEECVLAQVGIGQIAVIETVTHVPVLAKDVHQVLMHDGGQLVRSVSAVFQNHRHGHVEADIVVVTDIGTAAFRQGTSRVGKFCQQQYSRKGPKANDLVEHHGAVGCGIHPCVGLCLCHSFFSVPLQAVRMGRDQQLEIHIKIHTV